MVCGSSNMGERVGGIFRIDEEREDALRYGVGLNFVRGMVKVRLGVGSICVGPEGWARAFSWIIP